MGTQILLGASTTAETSGIIQVTQSMLPATLQSNGLSGAGETVKLFSSTGAEGAIFAQGVLTPTVIGDGNTVTIGTKVYTFQTILTDVDGNVKIGGDIPGSVANIRAAINLDGVAGVNYANSMTKHTQVRATSALGDLTAIALTAGVAGNSIVTTDTLALGDWDDPTLLGGGAPSPEEVIIDSNSFQLQGGVTDRLEINFPLRFEVRKSTTAAEVGVSISYDNQV